jgi:hypothetical protein
MPTDPLTLSEDAAVALIRQAVVAFSRSASPRPRGSELTTALLYQEKTAKQDRLEIPVDALLGTWRLCFSAGKKAKFQSGQPVGSGFYIPQWAIACLTLASNHGEDTALHITNELQVGPLKIRFTGPARYPGKKNLLVFDFTQLEVFCLGARVYCGSVGRQQSVGIPFAEAPIAKLPFFAFFRATDTDIAARGRGGGLAIWVKMAP